uniref:Uncharacterized protein n=1 Tax=Arundo donax TaxID=35708 RepID=A0A0A9A3F4_ARUDO
MKLKLIFNCYGHLLRNSFNLKVLIAIPTNPV